MWFLPLQWKQVLFLELVYRRPTGSLPATWSNHVGDLWWRGKPSLSPTLKQNPWIFLDFHIRAARNRTSCSFLGKKIIIIILLKTINHKLHVHLTLLCRFIKAGYCLFFDHNLSVLFSSQICTLPSAFKPRVRLWTLTLASSRLFSTLRTTWVSGEPRSTAWLPASPLERGWASGRLSCKSKIDVCTREEDLLEEMYHSITHWKLFNELCAAFMFPSAWCPATWFITGTMPQQHPLPEPQRPQ